MRSARASARAFCFSLLEQIYEAILTSVPDACVSGAAQRHLPRIYFCIRPVNY